MNWIFEPWPWYIGGPMIALVMALLLYFGKNFGMSSNLRTICTLCGAGRNSDFFDFDWKAQRWNLIVVVGAIIGGWIASQWLSTDTVVQLNTETVAQLKALKIESAGAAYLPEELFGLESLKNPKMVMLLALGGFLVGFGARYAGGCTSGHAISGLSNLQLASLYAVVGFFIGGLLMNHFLLTYLL